MRRRSSSICSSENSTWNGRIAVAVSTVVLMGDLPFGTDPASRPYPSIPDRASRESGVLSRASSPRRSGDRGFELGRAHGDAGGRVGVGRVECFGFEKRMGEFVDLLAVVGQQRRDFGVGLVDDPLHFLV